MDNHPYLSNIEKFPPKLWPLLFGLPPEDVQLNTVGESSLSALTEGYRLYRLVRDVCARQGRHTDRGTTVLDYGCGWGRIIRFFLTAYDPRNVYGVDVSPAMIEHCRSLIGLGQYECISGRPPLPFVDRSLDLLYAYSVFSHLNSNLQDALVAEFHRLIRPGGFVFLTTRPRNFIDKCVALKKRSDLDAYGVALAAAFPDPRQAKQRYDSGEFLFCPYPDEIGALGAEYGEAIVPRVYAEQHWSAYFNLVEFIDDPARLRQACFVLERR
jgi:SAM-dependent methyltransferase